MGLRVEPPDVNVSRAQFTVAGDAIHFGLAAIKNVGATAIDSIVKVRETDGALHRARRLLRPRRPAPGQPARDRVPDQGGRVRLAPRHARGPPRLARPGDGGRPAAPARPGGGAGLALRRAGRAARAQGGGGVSPRRGCRSGRRRRCWPSRRRCWASTSRATRSSSYREVARRIGRPDVGRARRPARPGARVLLLGQVSAFTESATKSGNRMAFATLELVDGSVPLTIFPEPYRSCATALRHKGPVSCSGRADDSDKGRVVLAEEIKPLEEAVATGAGRQRPRAWQRRRGDATSAHACRIRVSAARSRCPACSRC